MGDFFPHSRYNQLRPNIQLCILFLVESIEMKKKQTDISWKLHRSKAFRHEHVEYECEPQTRKTNS